MPECPYELAAAGAEWWAWAWQTPQASKWGDGHLYVVARRARLEDDVAALAAFNDHLDLADLLAGAGIEATGRVEWALRTLKGQASGKLTVEREMRELDDRLGLTPKASLGWKFDEPAKGDGLDDLARRRASRLAGGATA